MSLLSSQRPARLSRLPGICLALALGSGAYAGGIACDDPNNCQLPDQSGHGPDGTVAATSDVAAGFAVADNFAIDAGGIITDMCWWGTYTDFVVPCADGDVEDNFTITFLTNDPGCPTGAPAAILAGPFAVAVKKMATGLVIPSGLGDLVEFQYTATIPGGVVVGAGQCVWVEIQNDTTGGECLWLWETAEGDGGAFQNGAATNYDLAFCLNLPLGDTAACALAIDPLCEGAKGACGEGNGSPGCDDPCCCTLVCQQDPGCCEAEWDDFCAGFALKLGCATLPPCQAEVNCQVFDTVDALNSTGEGAFFSADDFTPAADGDITEICWYGAYLPDPPDPALDDFTVRYYDDVDGLPGNVLAEFSQSGGTLIGLVREDSGAQVAGLPLFVFSATHAPVAVNSGVCYWIEISNPNDGNFGWFWELAPFGAGNKRMVQDGGDGYDPGDLLPEDLAFCLGLELGSAGCLGALYDTGIPRTVLFDSGGNCNFGVFFLGFSSGNTAQATPQRWSAQAFTLPDLPAGGTTWQINLIDGFGFDPLGGLEQLGITVWQRTGLNVPVDGDQIVELITPAPIPIEHPEIAVAPPEVWWRVPVDFQLPPGDYWLTIYGNNSDNSFSNFAWFTNADLGINNLDKNGDSFMWRSSMFPDPGFEFYQLDECTLLPDNDTDPDDLYNLAFTVWGIVSGDGEPCPWDLDGSGSVGAADLLDLLFNWGPCPGCAADFDGDDIVGASDLLAMLFNWGPCP